MKKITALLSSILLICLLCSCTDSAKSVKVNLADVMAKIEKEVELPSEDMMKVTSTDKLTDYYGITGEDVASFEIRINSSGVAQDEIAMIEASSKDTVKKIEEALKTRLDSKTAQMKNYNADQYEILKKCSVKVDGLYVSMFISKDRDKMEEIYNSYFSK